MYNCVAWYNASPSSPSMAATTGYTSELIDVAIERAVTEAGLEKLKAEQVQCSKGKEQNF